MRFETSCLACQSFCPAWGWNQSSDHFWSFFVRLVLDQTDIVLLASSASRQKYSSGINLGEEQWRIAVGHSTSHGLLFGSESRIPPQRLPRRYTLSLFCLHNLPHRLAQPRQQRSWWEPGFNPGLSPYPPHSLFTGFGLDPSRIYSLSSHQKTGSVLLCGDPL